MPESIPPRMNPSPVKIANQLPINQEAKRHLDQAKEPTDQGSLYLLQLILWGLDPLKGHVLAGAPARRQALEDEALSLTLLPPRQALKFITLTDDPEDEESNLSEGSLSHHQEPQGAAWRAIDALDMVLKMESDEYPPKESPLPARRFGAEEDSSARDL